MMRRCSILELFRQTRLAQLARDIEALPSTVSINELHKIRESLDDFILFAMGVGGRAYEVALQAERIREALISEMRAAFSNNEEALVTIEKAETFHNQNLRKFYIPVMAQMLRERSPISYEDTLATILSEDPESIALVMSVLSEDTQALVRAEGLKMMEEALNNGYIDPQLEEKISALEGSNE